MHSTEHAVLEAIDRIISEMDKGNTPIGIFLDLSKAFDTLDHTILIQKLKYYGVSDNNLAWFVSYLENRKQYVEYENVSSETTGLRTGVPQGSILGPLLFIIYTNDIANASNFFETILYADDTTLLNPFTGLIATQSSRIINDELNKIHEWLVLNKLSLNVKKTKYMVFSTNKKKIESPTIVLNNTEIERVSNFTFLGVTLDENLSWKSHINIIACKLSRTTGLLNKLKHTLPPYILKTLYNSLILPHLNYGILAWGKNCDRLLKLQKKAIRIITNSKYNSHTEPIFKKECLLKLRDLYELNILKMYFKFKQNELPAYLQTLVAKPRNEVHNYNTRNQSNLNINKTKHKFADNCLRSQLPIIINSTPSIIKDKFDTHSFNGFCNYAKHYIIENYENSCNVRNCYVCNGS